MIALLAADPSLDESAKAQRTSAFQTGHLHRPIAAVFLAQ
jgi:hypothetical protein